MGWVNLWWDSLVSLLRWFKSNRGSSSADIYSETAYRDLVHREFKRSERVGHLCRILLVYRTDMDGLIQPLDRKLADKTIRLLSSNYRDTDYIGWYWQGRILGVLLTALRPVSVKDGYEILKSRLVDRLNRNSAFTNGHLLQIRVIEPGELAAFNSNGHPAPFSTGTNL